MSVAGEHGFTLLEMLVTLAIMALVAGIGFPVLSGAIAARALSDGTGDAVAALTAARAQARAQGATVTVALGTDGRTLGRVVLPAGVAVTWPGRGITFYGDGSADGGVVSLADARGRVRIMVAPATGRIVSAP